MQQPQNFAIGVTIFFFSIAALLAFLAVKQKPHVPPSTQYLRLTGQTPQVLVSFSDVETNTWLFRVGETLVLEFVWSPNATNASALLGASNIQLDQDSNLVVWDSRNGVCGPNAGNYAFMQAQEVQNYEEGTILAATPTYVNANSVLVTFQLRVYPGDVRIESTNGDGRYWSIFGPILLGDPPYGLRFWPNYNAPTMILWQSAPASFSVVAQFLSSGDLVLSSPDGRAVLWRASTTPTLLACD